MMRRVGPGLVNVSNPINSPAPYKLSLAEDSSKNAARCTIATDGDKREGMLSERVRLRVRFVKSHKYNVVLYLTYELQAHLRLQSL